MALWIDLGSHNVIRSDDVLAVIDWNFGRMSQDNRELVGYARAHGFLVEEGDGPRASMVVAKDRIFLVAATAKSIRKKLDRT